MAGGAEPAGLLEAAGPSSYEGDEPERSLLDDVEALIDDGKTYLEAELTYQKARAAYVAGSAKNAAIFGAVAAVFALLAAIGLTVGLIFALTPLITAWGATAVVVALLLVGAWLCVRKVIASVRRISGAMAGSSEPGA